MGCCGWGNNALDISIRTYLDGRVRGGVLWSGALACIVCSEIAS